jgi:hypothetical protein
MLHAEPVVGSSAAAKENLNLADLKLSQRGRILVKS